MAKFTVKYTGKGKRSPSGIGTFNEGDESRELELSSEQVKSLKAKGFKVRAVKPDFDNTAPDADKG